MTPMAQGTVSAGFHLCGYVGLEALKDLFLQRLLNNMAQNVRLYLDVSAFAFGSP